MVTVEPIWTCVREWFSSMMTAFLMSAVERLDAALDEGLLVLGVLVLGVLGDVAVLLGVVDALRRSPAACTLMSSSSSAWSFARPSAERYSGLFGSPWILVMRPGPDPGRRLVHESSTRGSCQAVGVGDRRVGRAPSPR